MPQIIEVAFKGNRKEFYLWEPADAPPLRAAVIVDADRGEDLGRVHSVGELALRRNAGTPHGLGADLLPEKHALRLATPEDVRRAEELAAQNEDARRRAAERVKANGLVMKLSDAEWQWDRKKLTFYFTAEKRVDFRNLVRDLASMFRTRIELKQIGVRDEARRLDGVGRCGRQYCSASWLPELRPVNLGVAKDQRLSLNPSQISGACGRLMCCLRYEHEFYVQSRKRFPKEGKILVTSLGEEKVVANDIFNDRVTLRRPDGDTRVVALADLRREIDVHAPAGALAGATASDELSGTDSADAAAAGADGEGVPSDDESVVDSTTTARRGARPGRPPAPPAARPTRPARPDGRPERQEKSERAERPERSSPGWLRARSPLPQLGVAAPSASAPDAAAPQPAPPAGLAVTGESAVTADLPAAAPNAPAVGAVGAVGITSDAGGDSGAPDGGDQERRARRRRGRRGGRRGRGGAGGGGNAGADAAGTVPGSVDDAALPGAGDDDSSDEE